MLHAAMALLGARKSADSAGAPLEALEPRLVLSAPTATPQSVHLTAGFMMVNVRYHSDTPVDPSTVGDDDIAATGPGGLAAWGHRENAYVDSNGDVLADYSWDAAGGRFASGTYNFGIAPDAVRNTAGEGNAEGGVASYWFWFSREITMTDQRLVTGTGPHYVDIFQYTMGDDIWSFAFQQNTSYLELAPELVVHVTSPNGYDQTTIAYEYLSYRQSQSPGYHKTVSGAVAAPGGCWDFTDNGVYTVQVGYEGPGSTSQNPVMGELLMTQTYAQNIGGPRAEVVASSVRMRDWLVTVRYTPAPGSSIDPASISDGDVGLGDYRTVRLTQPATLNGDGSVTAVYSIPSTSPDGWSVNDNGPHTIRTRPGEVRDSAGRVLGTGPLYTTTLSFDEPSIIGLRTLGAMVNGWDVELSFRNVGGVLNDMTLNNANLSVYAQINGVFQQAPVNVQFVSSANSPENILAIRYRILPRQGFLWDGTFTLQLNTDSISYWWRGDLVQAFVMHFAGPTVQGLRTLSRTNTSWDVELAWNNPGSLISTPSLSSQNLLVGAPGGRSVRVTLMSFVNGSDGVLRVRYRIAATTNGTALWHGAYAFSLRAGSVVAAGVGLPGQFLAGMTI